MSEHDKAIKALSLICTAIDPLDDEDRVRVLASAACLCDVSIGEIVKRIETVKIR